MSIEIEPQEAYSPLVTRCRTYTDFKDGGTHVQLLSNGTYSTMITSAGGGYSKCGDLAVTRWKADATLDNWGSYIFVRDHAQNLIWSTSYQPLGGHAPEYKVTFAEDKIEFRRRDGEISTLTKIIVAPEDKVEIRHVTLTNHSAEARTIELTSYLETVLGHATDELEHPAFSNLFIQTEFIPATNTLLAKRRPRTAEAKENWGVHFFISDSKLISEVQYETDRSKFLGRGNNLANADALSNGAKLSNSCGATLDPMLSLRLNLCIGADTKIEVAFVTGWARSREEAIALMERHQEIKSFEALSKLAGQKSLEQMKALEIDAETEFLYQRLAERILYLVPISGTRPLPLEVGANVESSLWPSGISGDFPIVLIQVDEKCDFAIIRTLLRCHEILRQKGIEFDLLFQSEVDSANAEQLNNKLKDLAQSCSAQESLGKQGGLFVLEGEQVSKKDLAYIQSVARVSLKTSEALRSQLVPIKTNEKYPESLPLTMEKQADVVLVEPALNLTFFNGTGGFSQDGREYILDLRLGELAPAPWINVIANAHNFGFQVSESGSGYTWSVNSQKYRLSPWSNDPVRDPPGEVIYLRDDETGEVWTPTPLPIRSEDPFVVRHGHGYSTFEHCSNGIQQTLTLFVPKDDSVKIGLLRLKNLTDRRRKISLTSYTEWVLGTEREKTASHIACEIDSESGAIFARNFHDLDFSTRVAFADISRSDRSYTCSRKEFLGLHGSYAAPAALERSALSHQTETGQDPCAVLQSSMELAAGEEIELSILLGDSENLESARKLIHKYRNIKNVRIAQTELRAFWDVLLNTIQVKTPEPAMNLMVNSWLMYQTLSCRYWARSAFYQSGGAYGFRDQLQDCMALIYTSPALTKEHILRAAARQFKEGDVQHWWHPQSGVGIRTRISDDLLWLPFVVSFYIKITGDKGILNERMPFLEAANLKSDQEESFSVPQVTSDSATLLEHCTRAINHSLSLGVHDLPLMGTGDWNDGMNRVGNGGKGESIWLGWFLYKVLSDFLPYCESKDQQSNHKTYRNHMRKLKDALERDGWDGHWYKRAYYDGGSTLGSAANAECKIDSIAQSWALISGAGDTERATVAMNNVVEFLVRKESQIILLLAPPFNENNIDPGYIKSYVPGVRENGGQYTHAAIWAMMAFAKLGDGNKAFDLYKMLNPILHSQTSAAAKLYKIEPYVVAGDVYSGGVLEGQGGWSWYTGSAAWYYRASIESLLGFTLNANKLSINPCIPTSWSEYEITYTFGKSKYLIVVKNPLGLSAGETDLELDGAPLPSREISLVDDGEDHQVTATMLR